MRNDRKPADRFALTQTHDYLVSAIYTSASVGTPVEPSYEVPSNEYWIKALWDTGATHSAISDRLAKILQLSSEDFVEVSTALGILEVPVYSVRVTFPNQLIFEDVEVAQFICADIEECDLIIGMDIITQGDLSITNLDGRTVFSFRVPSQHVVDFEESDY